MVSPIEPPLEPSLTGNVLIVDDEDFFARSLATLLRGRGHHVEVAGDARGCRDAIARHEPDVVLMDLHLPDGNGSELMAALKVVYPAIRFIIMTAHGTIRSAVQATQHGAIDYLTKPIEPDAAFVAVRNALGGLVRDAQVERLRDSSVRPRGVRIAAYPSPTMQATLARAEAAASQGSVVLLLGESGTGKDHLARWIHRRSARAKGPYFSINCAAVARELAESELFGHEPGAFTGTRGRKRGLLELAEQGTLLLDELGELEPSLQAKLLTFLDTRTFLRVGGERSVRVDARIIAATNRDLASEVAAGRFRKDLFYRINVFPIELPPLRERLDDLPVLLDELLDKVSAEMGLPQAPTLGPGVLERLRQHSWPGNVRELRNVLERALIASRGDPIEVQHLAVTSNQTEFAHVTRFAERVDLHQATRELARALVTEALTRAPNKTDAARLLGLSRHALAHQMRALGLETI